MKKLTDNSRYVHQLSLMGTVLLGVALLSGCGPGAGAWLVTMGLAPTEKIEAECHLPEGPILILVDDDQDLIQPPDARFMLVDELAKRLKQHELAESVTTNEELAQLRQNNPDFERRGIREIGQMAQADTVIHLSVIQFSMNDDLELLVEPGKFAVVVKVINAKADKREDVRIWPPDREGRLVEATVSPHELRTRKTLKEAHQTMASTMAEEIVKLFYTQEVGY